MLIIRRQIIADEQQAARDRRTKPVLVGAATRQVRTPFPSPGDWRDRWIYFLMIDRFNNPTQPPAGVWNQRFDFRQGGTFEGVLSEPFRRIQNPLFHSGGQVTTGTAAALDVILAPGEVQVLAPA